MVYFEWWQLSENLVLMFYFSDGRCNPEAGRDEGRSGSAQPEGSGSPRAGSPVVRASSRTSGSDSDSSEDDSDDGVMHKIKSSVTHIKVS